MFTSALRNNRPSLPPAPVTVLVLDLDETLIHTAFPLGYQFRLPPPHYRFQDNINGYIRAGLREFLQFCTSTFTHVGIWTAASPDYAHFIVNRVLIPLGFNPKFLLTSSDCEWLPMQNGKGSIRVKPLRKLWTLPKYQWLQATPENTLVVDDKPETALLNTQNLIAIRPFVARTSVDLQDQELRKVQQRLQTWHSNYLSNKKSLLTAPFSRFVLK